MSAAIVLTGTAYQRDASLTIEDGQITWRAQRPFASTPENIITNVGELSDVMWIERRGTVAGALLAIGSVVALAYGYPIPGIIGFAVAVAVIVHRLARPVRYFGVHLRDRWLVLTIDRESVDAARALAITIQAQLPPGD